MFITFEGGEGSGKTTQIAMLSEELRRRGMEVVTTREPGGTKLGEHIRNCLLNPDFGISFGPRAELLLFLASRVQHLEEVILPAISEGKTVICDRFNDSSVAYQGGARGLGLEAVRNLCSLACDNIEPDLTFFLDIDPEEGMKRLRRERDRLEDAGLQFHDSVREAFRQIALENAGRVQIVNAARSPEVVFSEILRKVDAALTKR
jgi:dTMP kinase